MYGVYVYIYIHGWGFHGVSTNGVTPKSSILIGFSLIKHPFWGTPIYGNPHKMITTVEVWLDLARPRAATAFFASSMWRLGISAGDDWFN